MYANIPRRLQLLALGSGLAPLRGRGEAGGFAVADLFQEAYRGAVADVEFAALVALGPGFEPGSPGGPVGRCEKAF